MNAIPALRAWNTQPIVVVVVIVALGLRILCPHGNVNDSADNQGDIYGNS
jgi:hypothetical protein